MGWNLIRFCRIRCLLHLALSICMSDIVIYSFVQAIQGPWRLATWPIASPAYVHPHTVRSSRTHTHTHTHTLWTPNYRADVQAEGDCRPVVPAMIRAFTAASLLSQAPGASAEGQGLLPNSASLSMHDTSTHASKVLAALSLWVKLAYNTLKLWLSYIKMHLN